MSRLSKGSACLVLALIVTVSLVSSGREAWANAPSVPTGLAVANPPTPTGTSLVLTWNVVTFSDHAGAGYRIYWSTDGGLNYILRADITNPATVTYTNIGLSHITYYYKILSYDTNNHESALSAAVSARPNRPPVFTVNRDSAAYGSAENASFSLACAATDPDLDGLTYSLTAGPDWLSSDGSGLVTGLVPWDAAEITGGVYTVTVRCTDGTDPITETFTLTITDTNRSPSLAAIGNQGPTAEGIAFSGLTASGSDPDPEDSLTYSISGQPATIGIDASTGAISGTIGYAAFENQPGDGHYTVTVTVTDNHSASDGWGFNWTVTNTNRAPSLAAIGNQGPTAEGAAFSGLSASGSDLDTEDALTYSISGQPATIGIDASTGAISGTIGYQAFEDQVGGHYHVTVTVTDEHAASASRSFEWTVTDTNRAPNFTGAPTNTAQTVAEGAGMTAVAATDPDADTPLTYHLQSGALPAGITFPDNTTGVFTGTVAYSASENGPSYTVTIRVSDGPGGLSTDTTLVITVTDTNEEEGTPPRIGPALRTDITLWLFAGKGRAFVNGYPRDFDAPPFIAASGRMMVPLRFISETLGAAVWWNPITHQVTIRGDWTEIVLTVGSTTARINGVAVTLDAPPVVINNRVYVPLRFICEALGMPVDYIPSSRSAKLHR